MNNKKPEQQLVRRKHSPQFKDQALEGIARDGVRQVAKDLGLLKLFLIMRSHEPARFGLLNG
ncbi:MAG: hypothetical protein Q8M40_02825 [Legionella sp.]|nr:hypothetical protein [Legionella sp.]